MKYLIKKIIIKILLLLLVAAVPIALYIFIEDDVQLTWNINTIKEMNKYTIKAEFFPAQEKLSVLENIEYINKTNKSIDKLFFHLNEIIMLENVKYQDVGEKSSNKEEKLLTKIGVIEYVKVRNKKASYKIVGKNNSLLMVNLDKELEEGNKLDIEIKYEMDISHLAHISKEGTTKYILRNWYPIAAEYNNGWKLETTYKKNKPDDVTNYYLANIIVPEGVKVEALGRLIEKVKVKGKYNFKFQGQDTLGFNVNIISTKN
ncbi:peptidase M1 membrane alanine aminopeptidase [Proteiniborus sp. DW1]|uniref:hypothetical protein n=1 Tax=Proteiniborus sp. DW1 TaxID=1889883 RepID=UPI00092E113F|nr:hypothetical protein [Proteiniborus sp. DW1]SCG84472.1 peptidase M1 membrane alanine aminopeptidase [Proteiniborus sp. DW1]